MQCDPGCVEEAGMTLGGARHDLPAGSLLLALVVAACIAGCAAGHKQSPPPTFTPAASAAAGRPSVAHPSHPLVNPNCLQGLTSYRFAGTFALHALAPSAASSPVGGEAGLAGSLGNLLGNVTFQGAAQAPDRYEAQIMFGGNGVQSLQIVRIAGSTYSRFGDGAWQQGDDAQGLTGVAQFDPQTLCENLLAPLDTAGQSPSKETVNGVPSLRYEVSGAQVLRGLAAGAGGRPVSGTATPGAGQPSADVIVWDAVSGGYPVRFQADGTTGAGSIDLVVNVTDVNGRDIRVSTPG